MLHDVVLFTSNLIKKTAPWKTEFEESIRPLQTWRLILCNENALSLFHFRVLPRTFAKKKLRSQVRHVMLKNWSDARRMSYYVYTRASLPMMQRAAHQLKTKKRKEKKPLCILVARFRPLTPLNPQSSFPHRCILKYWTAEITRGKMRRHKLCEVDGVNMF